MPEFLIIDRILNMYHTIHSARSLYKFNEYLLRDRYSEPGQKFMVEHFGKISIVFNYFCRKTQF